MKLREALRLPWDLMSVLVQCCREQCTVGPEFGFSNCCLLFRLAHATSPVQRVKKVPFR